MENNITAGHASAVRNLSKTLPGASYVYLDNKTDDYLQKVYRKLGISATKTFENLFLTHAFGALEAKLATAVVSRRKNNCTPSVGQVEA